MLTHNRDNEGQAPEFETVGQMTRTESHIIAHENGDFWVSSTDGQYTVYRCELTHSVADSSYPKSADGLSIAIARCNYLAKRRVSA